MSGETSRTVLPVAVLAFAGLIGLQSTTGQESWQLARGGVSSWQAGTVAKPAPSAGSGSFGKATGWSVPQRYFGSSVQAGGVWTEGSALPGSGNGVKARAAALGATHGIQLPKPAGLTLAPTPSHSTPILTKSQTAFAAGAHHSQPAFSSRFAKPNGKPGASFKFKRSTPVTPGAHGETKPPGSTGLGLPSNRGLGAGAPTGLAQPLP